MIHTKASCLLAIMLLTTLCASAQLKAPSTSKKSKKSPKASAKAAPKKNILHLYVISRHGSRAPSKKSVLSFNHENFKKLDAGEITQLGSAQSFIYGRALLDRYLEFFTRNNVTSHLADTYKVYYHDKDRIRETAINVLDGLFKNYRGFHPKILSEKHVYPPFQKPTTDLT
jgi:hypothetical protein